MLFNFKKFYFYLGGIGRFILFILLHCVCVSIYIVGYVLRLDSGEVKTRMCKNIRLSQVCILFIFEFNRKLLNSVR